MAAAAAAMYADDLTLAAQSDGDGGGATNFGGGGGCIGGGGGGRLGLVSTFAVEDWQQVPTVMPERFKGESAETQPPASTAVWVSASGQSVRPAWNNLHQRRHIHSRVSCGKSTVTASQLSVFKRRSTDVHFVCHRDRRREKQR